MQTEGLVPTCSPPTHPEGLSRQGCILQDLGYFGHFLHMHGGGRSGKQHMLIKLLTVGGTLQQRDLQSTEPISSASLSEVLTKLEREGLITRPRSEQDRRQLDITLTDEGWKEAQAWADQRKSFEQDALSVLSEDEQVQLLDVLDRMVTHWNTIEENEREKAMPEWASRKA